MSIQKILDLAQIRRYLSEEMPEGVSFSVFDIQLPSEDGDYSEYDGVLVVHSKEEKERFTKFFDSMAELFKIAVVCL